VTSTRHFALDDGRRPPAAPSSTLNRLLENDDSGGGGSPLLSINSQEAHYTEIQAAVS
jgi:hypothetical protein